MRSVTCSPPPPTRMGVGLLRRLRVEQEVGRPDVLAYSLLGAAEAAPDDQILHQIQTDLIGSIQVARADSLIFAPRAAAISTG